MNVYELNICLIEFVANFPSALKQQRCLSNTSSDRSGTSSGVFIHVAKMTEFSENANRQVIVFAWGDKNIFQAAVLPDTSSNRELFNSTSGGLQTSEILAIIKKVIADSDDVIFGETSEIDF